MWPQHKALSYKIDAMWAYASTFKDRFRTRNLFDQEYGMTEFHIVDPSGCLVFVGEITRDRNGQATP